ncbi:MAG TPA: ABC transporter ATP-binding protein [Bdellovibrionales bacterium]|nr:ABC transporter ATP-binding protein [Bdellovibrionales bacterium]
MAIENVPIRITNLVKTFGELRAVDNVSFEMKPGEVFGLLGPNGAGKTTVISNLVTLEEPTSGKVEIFGLDVTKEPQRAKMLTGFVPQEIINHGYFDVEEILEFHSGYFGYRKNKDRIEWILKKLSLWEHRKKKVKQLSGGMKRRLLIAKALVNDPKLLILDEPTAGVDIELRESLWRFVEELKGQGISILLTTHYIQEAEQLCDRVGIIQKGKLRRVGPTRELIKELTKREIVIRMKVPPIADPNHPAFLSRKGNELVFQVASNVGAGDLLDGLGFDLREVADLVIREGNLEDALKRVLGDVNV